MGLRVKLLVVSMRDEAVYASRVLRAGADGYVMKQAEPEELLATEAEGEELAPLARS